jgi:signal transduction histidine kinase
MPFVNFVRRYRSLESYVDWTAADAELMRSAWPKVAPNLPQIVDDFYRTIERFPDTARIITGGAPQIERLKKSLLTWLEQLFLGPHDEAYIEARRKIGRRHALIGLPQSYVNAALARLRSRTSRYLSSEQAIDGHEIDQWIALSKRMDLDMAIIEEAYQAEYLARQQPIHESRLRQQRGVVELGERALTASSLDSLLEFAAALLGDILAVEQVLIIEASTSLDFTVRAAFGFDHDSPGNDETSFHSKHLVNEVLQKKTLLVDDDLRLRQEAEGVMLSPQRELISAAACPILGNTGIWGLLLAHSYRVRPFEAMDQDCLQAAANIMSASIQRSQSEALVRQNERLAGIGQMIAGLAHESRNALQRIQACTELLQMELPVDGNEQALTQRIARAADDLNQLFEEVRQYAAPIVLDKGKVDLVKIWRSAWGDICQVYGGRHTQILSQGCPEELIVVGDAYRLRQVFRNLFENALAASEDPVRIEVKLEVVQENDAPIVRIQVHDSGAGIDARHVQRAFEPFFTTKSKGTGLGLSICRRIIEAHGGTICFLTETRARSVLRDRGATVEIKLPKG